MFPKGHVMMAVVVVVVQLLNRSSCCLIYSTCIVLYTLFSLCFYLRPWSWCKKRCLISTTFGSTFFLSVISEQRGTPFFTNTVYLLFEFQNKEGDPMCEFLLFTCSFSKTFSIGQSLFLVWLRKETFKKKPLKRRLLRIYLNRRIPPVTVRRHRKWSRKTQKR